MSEIEKQVFKEKLLELRAELVGSSNVSLTSSQRRARIQKIKQLKTQYLEHFHESLE